jgi:ubiquinone/menaquinone biosynthesis C-methylase UbiE
MAYSSFDQFVARCRFRAAISYVMPGSRVCDIGSGIDAAFLFYATARISLGVGLDYQKFSPRAAVRCRLVQCDLSYGVPLASETFDHVVMLAVLEHIENPKPTFAEIFRILKPGGSLIMTWPHSMVDPLLNLLHRLGIVSGEMESDKHQPRIPREHLISMLRQIGFREFAHKKFELGMNNLLVSCKP